MDLQKLYIQGRCRRIGREDEIAGILPRAVDEEDRRQGSPEAGESDSEQEAQGLMVTVLLMQGWMELLLVG